MYLNLLADALFMNLRMYFFILSWQFRFELWILSVRQFAITVKISPNCFLILRRPWRFDPIFSDKEKRLIEVLFILGIRFIFAFSIAFKYGMRGLPFEISVNSNECFPREMLRVEARGSCNLLLNQKVYLIEYSYNQKWLGYLLEIKKW